jgi:hypothetical protein
VVVGGKMKQIIKLSSQRCTSFHTLISLMVYLKNQGVALRILLPILAKIPKGNKKDEIFVTL